MAVAVGLVGLVVTAAVAASGPPGAAEVSVFRWFNDPPRAIGTVMGLVNPLLRPTALTVLTIAVVGLLFVTLRDVFWPLIVSAGASGVLAYLAANVMKVVIDRGRPPIYLADVLSHGYPVDPHGTGYPSSHTAVSVAVVVGAWPWLSRPWKVGGVVAAAAIGLNRMYVGAHFPLDILGGIAIGLLVAGTVLVAVGALNPRRAVSDPPPGC